MRVVFFGIVIHIFSLGYHVLVQLFFITENVYISKPDIFISFMEDLIFT